MRYQIEVSALVKRDGGLATTAIRLGKDRISPIQSIPLSSKNYQSRHLPQCNARRVVLLMDIETMEAKTKFLDVSACHYAVIAPATSAHLMLKRSSEAAENSVPLQVGGSRACRACGTILIPGSTSRTSIVHEKATKTKVRSKKHAKDDRAGTPIKFVRVDCLICHGYEKKSLQDSSGTNIKKPSVLNTRMVPSVSVFADKEPSDMPQTTRVGTASASSKQRAKARRHGGLQAMLEKSKASVYSSPGFGLDLLDLMKQS